MRITRRGNRKGLDIDYQVNVDSKEDVKRLHQHLTGSGLLFLYMTGDNPYEPIESNKVFHYIDKDMKLYDFAFLFTEQAPKIPKERKSKLDESYERAKSDVIYKRKLMNFMKYHKLLTAFRKHLRAYGEFKKPYINILNQVMKQLHIEPFAYTDSSLKQLDMFLFESVK